MHPHDHRSDEDAETPQEEFQEAEEKGGGEGGEERQEGEVEVSKDENSVSADTSKGREISAKANNSWNNFKNRFRSKEDSLLTVWVNGVSQLKLYYRFQMRITKYGSAFMQIHSCGGNRKNVNTWIKIFQKKFRNPHIVRIIAIFHHQLRVGGRSFSD